MKARQSLYLLASLFQAAVGTDEDDFTPVPITLPDSTFLDVVAVPLLV